VATRAGWTRRNQKKGDRWGERLVTFTLPHDGGPVDRIKVLDATWGRFIRTFLDEERAKLLGKNSGITLADLPPKPEGFDAARPFELELIDLLSYLRVIEWTPGNDGLGHPHFHVWMFSRYLDRDRIQGLWEEAYAHVTKQPRRKLALVDIRKAGGEVAEELVKYLTKDWEITPDGAKRAEPDVFAQVYATLDGKRRRQTSSGFAMWAVEKLCACPTCGHESERGHWGRVDITHALEGYSEAIGTPDWEPDTPAPLTAADVALKAEHDENRDQEWSTGDALRILRHRLRHMLA